MATRRERVILELEDKFSAEVAGAAAKTALLNRELQGLSDSADKSTRSTEGVKKSTKGVGDETQKTSRKTREYTLEMAMADEKASRLRKTLRDQAKAALDAADGIDQVGDKSDGAGKKIDRLSGRMQLIAEAALVLGPALIPIGGALIPALSTMAIGMTAAAGAVGVAVLAFKGMGDSLKALNTYQLEPTAANLEKMQIEMDKIGPSGEHFVRFLDSLGPQLTSLQDSARAGLFPGVEDGIESLMGMLPQVREIVSSIAREMGSLAREAGAGLAGDGFSDFFAYLESDAAPTLAAFGHTIGNVAEGLGHLMVAFAPLSRDFTGGMESMTASFANWAQGLSQTDGFRSFVDYIQSTGPQVLDLLGALSSAFVGIIQAAAPVGQALLPALTALANVLGAIAGSPIGPAIFGGAAAFLALNRAVSVTQAGMDRLKGSTEKTGSALGGFAGKAAGIAAVSMAVGSLADSIGRINSADLDRNLTSLSQGNRTSMTRGLVQDLDDLDSTLNRIDIGEIFTFGGIAGDSTLDKTADNIEEVDQALAQMVETGDRASARKIFANLMADAKRAGVDVDEARKMFDAYKTALENGGPAANGAARGIKRIGDAAGNSKSQLEGLTNAMKEQRQVALAAFDAETQYRQALKDAGKQAAKNNAGIRGSSKDVLENRSALTALAGAWNNQSKAVKNSEGRYQEARAALIRTAEQMGVGSRRARQLADDLLEIPRSHVTQISLTGSDEALNKLFAIKRVTESIPTRWSTDYYVNQVNSISKPHAPFPSADGGTVPRSGKPYADRYHYLLADGEEVISNRYGQADRNRELLKAINANRLADGGTVARYAAAAARSSGGATRVEHVVTVRVAGEMDLSRAKAQIRQVATEISRNEVDADRSYQRTLGRQGVVPL